MKGRVISKEVREKISKNSANSIPVIQKDKKGNKIKEYRSFAEASKSTGAAVGRISDCCKNLPEFRTACGFRWEYKTNN